MDASRGLRDKPELQPPADLLIVGGRVFVGGRSGRLSRHQRPAPTALAVKGERIAAVGTDAALVAWRGAATEVIDARGGSVMAGFDDAHTHLRWAPATMSRLDLFGLTDLGAVQDAIRRYAAAHADRPWVAGRGWLYAAFPGGMPIRQQLDAAVPDRPAYFECFDGHSGWANSRALEAAGIGRSTTDPRDGRIVRDASGKPTGALLERARELVETRVPRPDAEESVRLVRDALLLMARAGITAIQDAWGQPDDFRVLDRIRSENGLPLRVRIALEMLPGLDEAGHAERLDEFAPVVAGRELDLWLRGGILKSFVDGVVEAGTAYLLQPYPGSRSVGAPRWGDDELRQAVDTAHRRGWQVELHAIGTAAVRQALDAYETLGKRAVARRRHRIEHIETIDPEDLPRFAQLGVVASVQPLHGVPEAHQMAVWAGKLGPEVSASGWRIRSLLDSGTIVAFGSDWPVVPFNPFYEIHAAVNRTTIAGLPNGGWLPAERLRLPDALAAATWGSAYAEHAEGSRGRLVVGGLADLIVLDRDLLAEDSGAVIDTRVRLTVIGGRVIYRELG